MLHFIDNIQTQLKIGALEAMLTQLFLENNYFTGDRELDKVFFTSNPDLHVAKIVNSLKVSLFSKNLNSTMNQSLNEV